MKLKNKRLYEVYKPSTTLFIIFASLFSLDFITTILALNLKRFEGMFYEANPIAFWFQSFGVIGYMLGFICGLIFLYFVAILICKLMKRIKNKDFRANLYLCVVLIYIVLEGNVIFNNIMQMTGIY